MTHSRAAVAALLSLLLPLFAAATTPTPGASSCTTEWFSQRIDHFSAAVPPGGGMTYQQRYLVCAQFYRPSSTTGALFFYNGNEGDVTLYANHTGLMWENAAAFNALLVFAEHRYYGLSLPYPDFSEMRYLTSQQALADYVVLIAAVKARFALPSTYLPVITFGGSYGGVLAAMLRSKYPGSVDGAIAASAPLRAFPGQVGASWDSSLYYAVITRDASAAGGASDACAANIRALWPALFADGATPAGRALLSSAFTTCDPVETADDALALALWIRGSFDDMSMGNYPYPSSYITGGAVVLPAFPVRVACSFLAAPLDPVKDKLRLYAAVAAAVGVVNNATVPPVSCFQVDPNPYTHPSEQYDGIWDYQRCTELQPDSFWFSTSGVTDMFWALPQNLSFTVAHCAAAWGVPSPDYTWIATAYDLPALRGASNIVFSSGELDPWGGAGILTSPAPERDLVSINVSLGAHHLDLMFSNPLDPPGVTAVRVVEVQYIAKWVEEARARGSGKGGQEL